MYCLLVLFFYFILKWYLLYLINPIHTLCNHVVYYDSDFMNKSGCVQWFLLFNAILVHWWLFITVLEYGSWINPVTETTCIVFKEIMVYRMRDSNPWLMIFFLWTILLSCCCCKHFCWIHWNFSPVHIVTINTYLSDHVHLCCQITCLHVNTSCCHLTRPTHCS